MLKKLKQIEIRDSSGELVDKIDTGEQGVLVGKRKDLIGTWDTNVIEGVYTAKAILQYDGKEEILEKEFS